LEIKIFQEIGLLVNKNIGICMKLGQVLNKVRNFLSLLEETPVSENERILLEKKEARRKAIDKAWKEGTLYDKKRKN